MTHAAKRHSDGAIHAIVQ